MSSLGHSIKQLFGAVFASISVAAMATCDEVPKRTLFVLILAQGGDYTLTKG